MGADFEGAGGSAALVDLDPQASAALWGDRRARSPFVGTVPAARLEAALGAARAADLTLVPLVPACSTSRPWTPPPACAPSPAAPSRSC